MVRLSREHPPNSALGGEALPVPGAPSRVRREPASVRLFSVLCDVWCSPVQEPCLWRPHLQFYPLGERPDPAGWSWGRDLRAWEQKSENITCLVTSIHRILQGRITSGQLFPSPGDLPNPGTEPTSPALQVDSLPPKPPGKPNCFLSDFDPISSLTHSSPLLPSQFQRQLVLSVPDLLSTYAFVPNFPYS